MIALIVAILFFIIIIINILIILGFPLGELTMGGKYKVLPTKFRIMAFLSLIVQVFAVIFILQARGYISPLFSMDTNKIISIVFAAYLSFNTIMNLLSNSKKEKCIMTPISLLTAICFWITAYQM